MQNDINDINNWIKSEYLKDKIAFGVYDIISYLEKYAESKGVNVIFKDHNSHDYSLEIMIGTFLIDCEFQFGCRDSNFYCCDSHDGAKLFVELINTLSNNLIVK